MRRFALAILVALLSLSASGVATLVIGEPCTGVEQSTREDGTCPPTCVFCGCCAQAAEPVGLFVSITPDVRISDVSPAVPHLLKARPQDILHVPKSATA